MTGQAFDRLLAHLAPDREVAAQEYERVRRMLLNFFGWRGCPSPDEPADETLDRVARKLDEGVPVEHVHRYIYGVARRVFTDWTRQRDRERDMLAEWRPADASSGVDEDRSACLAECLPRLSPDGRELLAEYYQGPGRVYLKRRKLIAERLGITEGALRVRAHRARTEIESCISECVARKRGRRA